MAWKSSEETGVRVTYATWPNTAGVDALRYLRRWTKQVHLDQALTAAWVDDSSINLYFCDAVMVTFEYNPLTGIVGELKELSGV